MSSVTWETISRQAETLPLADQRRLVERIAARLLEYAVPSVVEYDDFAAMARDPDIQREMRAIQAEFACADADGLHLENVGA